MKKIPVHIIEANEKGYKLKFPFLKVPVQVDENFFRNRMNKEAYQIVKGINGRFKEKKVLN